MKRDNLVIVLFAFLIVGCLTGVVYSTVPQGTTRTTGAGITTYVGHYFNATEGIRLNGVDITSWDNITGIAFDQDLNTTDSPTFVNGTFSGGFISDGTNWYNTTDHMGSDVRAASYIIGFDGTNYYAKNGVTGQKEYTNVDCSRVIEDSINNYPLSNGPLLTFLPSPDAQEFTCLTTINANKIFSIVGPTRNRIILKLDVVSSILFNVSPADYSYILEFHNVKLQGSGGSGSIGVLTDKISEVVFNNVEVRSFATGVKIDGAGGYNEFTNCWFLDGTIGVHAIDVDEIKIIASYTRIIHKFEGTIERVIFNDNIVTSLGKLLFTNIPRNVIITGNIFQRYNDVAGTEIELKDQDAPVTAFINIKNNIFDNTGSQPAANIYAIKVGTNVETVTIEHNSFNNVTPITGTGTYNIRRNEGYVTENIGLSTVLNGTTAVTITHGLNYTPTTTNTAWTVSYLELPTNDPGPWYIDGFNATSAIIHVLRDPGASNLDISWSARRTP